MRPMMGRESGKHGRQPSQVLSSARCSERKQLARLSHHAVELHRRRLGIARRELDAGGHADAHLHRRDHIADVGIEHRPRQRRVALRREMPVIAALDRERQLEPELRQEVAGPGPERRHHLRRVDTALVGLHPPAVAQPVQRARVARHRHAAELGEAIRIGARQRIRVAHARRLRPEHGVLEHRRQIRLQALRSLAIERLQRQAQLARQFEFALERGKACLFAINLQPAGLAQKMRGARFLHQRFMLADRAAKQRPDKMRGLEQPLRLRGGAERHQPGRDPGQEREAIIGFTRALECDAHERAKVRRESRRKNGVALDNAGITERGLLAEAGAIDQRNAKPALGEMQRHAGADDAGAQNDRVGTCH